MTRALYYHLHEFVSHVTPLVRNAVFRMTSSRRPPRPFGITKYLTCLVLTCGEGTTRLGRGGGRGAGPQAD